LRFEIADGHTHNKIPSLSKITFVTTHNNERGKDGTEGEQTRKDRERTGAISYIMGY
jgi:hypothetical protein